MRRYDRRYDRERRMDEEYRIDSDKARLISAGNKAFGRDSKRVSYRSLLLKHLPETFDMEDPDDYFGSRPVQLGINVIRDGTSRRIKKGVTPKTNTLLRRLGQDMGLPKQHMSLRNAALAVSPQDQSLKIGITVELNADPMTVCGATYVEVDDGEYDLEVIYWHRMDGREMVIRA